MIAGGAGDLLESEWHIWLCPQIKLHVGMDWKRIKTLLADAPPVSVSSHRAFIDGKARLLTDSAWDRVQPPFHFLLRERDHLEEYSRRGKEIATGVVMLVRMLDAPPGQVILTMPCT